jgi:hypothetical protein
MMAYMPYANWEAIVLVVIVWFWIGSRQESKLALVNDEKEKLKDQLDEANEELQLFEFCIQEEFISKQYELSDEKHPEMYTEERLPFGYKAPVGWSCHYKPKPEFENQIDLSRKLFVSEMIALQEKYKSCLQAGASTEYLDENFWLWFQPAYKHPYFHVSWFVRTGKDNWVPPDLR